MSYDGLIILLFQKSFKSKFNLRLDCHMLPEFPGISSLQENFIFIVIFFHKGIYIRFRNGGNTFRNLIDRISVDFPPEFNLRLHLVAFGNGHIAHIIRHTHHADMAAFNNTDGSSHPHGYFAGYNRICPVTHNHFPLDPHPAYNMSVFTVAVSRLVFIHEIHID